METTVNTSSKKSAKKKTVSYAKWGYIFIASFFVVYAIFTLFPQILTIYDSFWDYTKICGRPPIESPEWGGFINYQNVFKYDADLGTYKIWKYFGNTILMWVIGAVPQFIISIVLALLFTSSRLKLKGLGFFKSVFYMPNLIMATAFAALFLVIFDTAGPIHNLFVSNGWIPENFDFILDKNWSRFLVAAMNFLMWFGNTTILLMAGIQGIDESVFEAARMDGASSNRVLFDITLPLLKPIVVYVFITSMIGGLQMYDVPYVLTGKANNLETKTIVMYINEVLRTYNYGMAGAISVVLFIVTGILSLIVFKTINRKED